MKAGWTEVALGDVARIDRRSVTAAGIAEGTLYVGLEDIDAGGGSVRPHPVRAGELGSNKFVFDSQHILYGKLRPYLAKIASAPGSGICSTDILPIRPTGVDRAFLLHFLRQPAMVGHAAARSSGANLPRLAPTELEKFRLPLPPLEEQKRIAAILDKADELQAKRRAAESRLDALGNAVFSESASVDSKTSPLDEFLISVTSGARGWAKYYSPTGSRFVRSFDVQMNSIESESAVWVQAPDSAEAKRIKVRENDVLLTITGSRIGRVAAAPQELEGAYVSQHVAILRIDSSRLCPAFLARYLSLDGQRQIRSAHYGQTKPGLNFKQIRSFRIPVLSLASQRSLMARIEQIDWVRAQASSSADELESLIASLQARAFRGEL